MSSQEKLQPHYSSEAYRPDRIPKQAASLGRGLVQKFTCTRLPWGYTQDVIPVSIMEDPKPESMRFWEQSEKQKTAMKANGEYIPRPLEDIELHSKYDHARFRFAQLPSRSQFWLLLSTICKWGIVILLPASFFMDLIFEIDSGEFNIIELSRNSITILLATGLIPTWAVSTIIVNYFPRLWFKPPNGPLWELNRVTGQAIVFDSTHPQTVSRGEDFVAPFYEFDAYIVTAPDRQGLPVNGLQLIHRYGGAQINLNSLFTPDNTTQKPCATWDFLQNFMDTQRPLPDIPLYEPYRQLDPVTAIHDKKTNRPPRYWIDMDKDIFKTKVTEMLTRIDAIDTLRRPNLMAIHVSYVD